MSLKYYLNLALNKEKNSIELYKDLLETHKKLGQLDKDVRNLFSFLIKEETKHKKLIERLKKIKARRK